MDDVPENAWHIPDYFKTGNQLQVDGTKSKIIISPECEGVYGEINPFSGNLFLRGVPEKAGTYKVSVYLATDKGDATSNEVVYKVYTGNEKLSDQLTYENCTKTADGKYMYDSEPWYMEKFGGENETVTVPKDIKAWYGSHAVLPEVNYSEIGRTISLTDGEELSQTLIIPKGCNLTMVNMRVHSGVKIVVGDGAKLTLRQTTIEGIIEVQSGGTFSMDYNDFEGGEWLHGSMINGQLQMKDGSVLENARITCHANYLAEGENDTRRNFELVVTTEGNVTVKSNVYILGEEAPSGEAAQAALKVNGTLTVPEGSVLACYGGGTSMLTADGGDAIVLNNGTITGTGSVIAIGGYGMNITGDTTKGSGGAAVSGSGKIAVANAYLEGGASYHAQTAPIKGAVKIADTTNRKLVTGKGETTGKSEFYWFGTGDANGIVPQIEKTLEQIPQNAPAGVSAGKTSVKVTINWTDGADKHANDTVTANVKDSSGKTVKTAQISAKDDWSVEISGLAAEKSYTVEVDGFADNYATTVTKSENVAGDSWEKVGYGDIEENETYIITYEDGGKTYILGASGSTLGSGEWNSSITPDLVTDEFKWVPVESTSKTYGQWYLMNQSGNKNTYLSMDNSGPVMCAKSSYDYYYTLFADNDGSLWNGNYSKNFYVKNGKLTTDSSSFTKFTFYKKVAANADEFTVSAVSYTKVAAEEPTHKDAGNVEYYVGSDGNYYLSNGEDFVEVTADEVKVAAIPCKVTITSATGGSIRVVADYDDENGGRQIYSGAEVPYGTELYVIREVNTGFTLENGKTYETETLTVDDDIEISLNAVKKTYKLNVTAENGSYTTDFADETAVPYGTQVTLTAGTADSGYEFIGWYQTNGKQLTASASYTATITSDYAIEARYQATSGVVNFMVDNAVVKTITVEAGEFTSEVVFPVNPSAAYGFEFTRWSMTDEDIKNALEKGKNVNVEAVFEPVKLNFTVKVYNGNSETAEEISCTESTIITRTAETVEGKNFAYWTLDGAIFSYNRKASYTAIKGGELKAVYASEAVESVGTATMRTAKYNADAKQLTVNAYLTVPDGCLIQNAGLVASESTDNLTWGKAQFNKSLASAKNKCVPVNYTWTKTSVELGDVWYVRAYVSYIDSVGNSHEVYGDTMSFTAGNDYDSSEKGTATIRTATYNASTKQANFNAYLTVPDNGVVVESGLVAASNSSSKYNHDTAVLTSENADFVKSLASAKGKSVPVNYTWTKTKVNPGDVWYARAYLVYTLDGVEHTVYGDLTTLTAK